MIEFDSSSLSIDFQRIYQDINQELALIGFDKIEIDMNSLNSSEVYAKAGKFAAALKERTDSLINSENDIQHCCGDGNFITYIFFRYNECVLWDLSGNEVEFQKSLSKLNKGLTSRLIDDSCASEKLFLYVAELNFKVHNYTVARKFIDKSIKLECRQDDDSNNVTLRFHKRCLKAFCCEYSYIPIADGRKCTKENPLVDAVICLIGRNPKDFVVGGCMFDEFKHLIKAAYQGENETKDIIEKIYDKAVDSLAKKYYDSYSNFISVIEQKNCIEKIAHILAHCFSEIHKWGALKNYNVHESVQLFSMAEILMKSLGDEYITCYSTVLLEDDQHMLAIDEMISIREKHKTDWAGEEHICELAQIDFYIWYFSVIAKKFADQTIANKLNTYIEKYKENFEAYKNAHKDDLSARTYYELLSMKEELICCFSELKSGDFKPQSCKNLIDSYQKFSKSEPKKNIHIDIQDEWKLLDFAYYIFLSCYRYNITQQDWYLFDIEERLLSQNFYGDVGFSKSLNTIKSRICGGNYRDVEAKQHIYCEITLPYGKFIYIGSHENVMEDMLAELGVNYKIEVFADNKSKRKIKDSLSEISNVLFIYSEVNKEFLEFLCHYSNYREYEGENKPNVFIYDGLLNMCTNETIRDRIADNDNKIKQIISGTTTFRKIDNLKTVIRYCAMFSALESCIGRVYKSLNTLVISPIESVRAYSDQSVEEAIFLMKKEVGSLMPAQSITEWRDGFKACFAMQDKKIKAKCMHLSRFQNGNASKIDAVLLIENPKNIFCESKIEETSINVYAFESFAGDIAISYGTTKVFPYDQNLYQGNKIYSCVKSLYDSRTKKTPGKLHTACSNYGSACRSVFYDAIHQPNEFRDSVYRDFIDVLYSYRLLKRTTIDRVSKTEKNYALTWIQKVGFIFCIFKEDSQITGCENFCKAISECISDAQDDDYSLFESAETDNECSGYLSENEVLDSNNNMAQQESSLVEHRTPVMNINMQLMRAMSALEDIQKKITLLYTEVGSNICTTNEIRALLLNTLTQAEEYFQQINNRVADVNEIINWTNEIMVTINRQWSGTF